MKATCKNQIIDLLQWSTVEYEERVFQAYWNWCINYGQYQSIIQQMLAHRGINKWFLEEYIKLELQFLAIAEVVPNQTSKLESHYKSCTAEIMAIYPKPLIDAIKKNLDFIKISPQNSLIIHSN